MPHEHDRDIIDRLRTVHLGEEPPLRLDVVAARHAGTRIRRRRRLAATGTAAVAVVAAAGLTATALAAGGRGADRAPAGTPTAGPPAPVTRFDPMVQQVDWGWLPDGLTGRTAQLDPLVERLDVHGTTVQAQGTTRYGRQADLTVTVPGGEDFDVAESVPAPDVNGVPAVWITRLGLRSGGRPGGAAVDHPMLSWAWTPGGQAVLSLGGQEVPSGQEGRDMVLRMARSLKLDAHVPVRFPFTVTGMTDLKPCQTTIDTEPTSPQPWSGSLELSRTGSCPPGKDSQIHALGVRVSRNSDRKGDPKVGYPNTTVDGHLAVRSQTGGHDSLTVFDVDGCRVAMSLDTVDLGGAIGTRESLPAMIRKVRVVDSPDRTGNWITDPLR
ncbi:MAG: hypothetical protein ACJ73S_17795 [Mycobacteriales bacterium]